MITVGKGGYLQNPCSIREGLKKLDGFIDPSHPGGGMAKQNVFRVYIKNVALN